MIELPNHTYERNIEFVKKKKRLNFKRQLLNCKILFKPSYFVLLSYFDQVTIIFFNFVLLFMGF